MNWASFSKQDFDRTNSQFDLPKITESEWLTSNSHYSMVSCLPPETSRRKLRLFACASVRLVWRLVKDDRAREALTVAEMFADGLASIEELGAAYQVAFDAYAAAWAPLAASSAEGWGIQHQEVWASGAAADAAAPEPPLALSIVAAAGLNESYWNAHGLAQFAACEPHFADRQAAALRDLVGNPFRTVAADRRWLTNEARSLAERMYQERDFHQFPDLRIHLEQVGCDNPAIVEHCRSGIEHFRGCWLIDLLTGRS